MTDTSEANQPAARPAIPVEEDVPCPQCGYNPRGLAELRCPECGERFESQELLRQYARGELPPPSLLWSMWNIYIHPLAFWEAPSVRFGLSPALTTYLAIVGLPPALLWLSVAALNNSMLEIVMIFLGCLLLPQILMLLAVIHAVLCHKALPSNEGEDTIRRAFSMATYSAAWLAPMLLCLIGSVITEMHIPWLAGVLLCAGLWVATLYKAGLVLSGGRHRAAVLCVMVNPSWLVAGLVILVMAMMVI